MSNKKKIFFPLLVVVFGVAGIVLGVLYSLGPVKLASLGLGEIAVTLGFGVIPVTGAAPRPNGSRRTPRIPWYGSSKLPRRRSP